MAWCSSCNSSQCPCVSEESFFDEDEEREEKDWDDEPDEENEENSYEYRKELWLKENEKCQ